MGDRVIYGAYIPVMHQYSVLEGISVDDHSGCAIGYPEIWGIHPEQPLECIDTVYGPSAMYMGIYTPTIGHTCTHPVFGGVHLGVASW